MKGVYLSSPFTDEFLAMFLNEWHSFAVVFFVCGIAEEMPFLIIGSALASNYMDVDLCQMFFNVWGIKGGQKHSQSHILDQW